MRLTERRFRIKSTISYQNIDGENESRATVSTETRLPFVRPCAVVKMFDCASNNGKELHNSSRSTSASKANSDAFGKSGGTDHFNKEDIHGNQTSCDR